MTASDVLAIVAATLVAVLGGALIAALYALVGTRRQLRAAVVPLQDQTQAPLDDAYDTLRDATHEVDRIDRIVGSAEKINGAVDGAQRLAYRTFANPVVKAMAFGSGVSRAAQRIREGEPPAPTPARTRAARTRRRPKAS